MPSQWRTLVGLLHMRPSLTLLALCEGVHKLPVDDCLFVRRIHGMWLVVVTWDVFTLDLRKSRTQDIDVWGSSFRSFWNLAGLSTVLLPRRPLNRKSIWLFQLNSFCAHWCHRLYHDTTLFVECKGSHLNPIEPLRRCAWNHISNKYVHYRLFQVPHSPDKSLHSRTQFSIFLLKDLACRLQRHEKDKMTPTCLPIKISSNEVSRSTPSMDLANGPLWCCSLSCLVSSGGVGRERVWQCAGADTWD